MIRLLTAIAATLLLTGCLNPGQSRREYHDRQVREAVQRSQDVRDAIAAVAMDAVERAEVVEAGTVALTKRDGVWGGLGSVATLAVVGIGKLWLRSRRDVV